MLAAIIGGAVSMFLALLAVAWRLGGIESAVRQLAGRADTTDAAVAVVDAKVDDARERQARIEGRLGLYPAEPVPPITPAPERKKATEEKPSSE